MKIDIAQFAQAFFEEAKDHLAQLESSLLELEKRPQDAELLAAIFRAAHSIKGGSATFGMTEVARFTHELEGLLDELRAGSLQLTRGLSDLLLEAADALAGLLESAKSSAPAPASVEPLLERLKAARAAPGAAACAKPEAVIESQSAAAEYRISFAPSAGIFCSGGDPLLVLRDLGELGEVRELRADYASLPPLEELDPEKCHFSWTLVLSTKKPESEVRSAFVFVEDVAQISIERAVAVAEKAAAPSMPQARASDTGTLRVATSKVDKLVDLVGELVIAQSMISGALELVPPAIQLRVREALAALERHTRDLQEGVMSIRMLPVSQLFERFPRLARDLARSLGKEVELQLEGGDTELDKAVLDQLADPLTHLVRNAIDHGLETPADRVAAGKPAKGTLRLRAAHQGGAVSIEVSDDGRGLDGARIRKKAEQLGLIAPGEPLTEAQEQELIFRAGFSTAAQVTDVSGRGVGMDVVKRNIEALDGAVSLRSAPGRGTTCAIKLPLTMAILDGLRLRVAQQTFVLPLIAVLESFRPREADLRRVLGQGEIVMLRDEPVPLVRLHRIFDLPGDEDARRGLVTVVDAGGVRVGLLVDELLGQSQVVIKSLEANFRRLDGVAAATILGDGQVALILDPPALARMALGPSAEVRHAA